MGERRLDAALERFSHKDKVEIIYRCYELDPHMDRNVDYDIYEKLSMKYGMSREQAISACNDMKKQAESVGLVYNFDNMVLTNTFDAHRLTLYAGEQGKMLDMSERLFRALFTESLHIGDHKTLAELAVQVGLDPDEVAKVLEGDQFTKEVRADEQEAVELGVRGVPFYVINRRYAISGAQPPDVFLQALEKAWQEENPLTLINEDGEVCDDTGCRIPGTDK
ncbi:DsbA family oxidoreductase [Ammoniphilus sp. CFH 90114]|uniref:DsbA family oxidoreductase n=1 Tax=Ammoniphilus sp. CFH 90114 TaxID=2493665 RepID=UPI002105D9EA|nr:DsbA family oxidoreductase [Ammoniphilus sp. CFH 90114]